MATTNVIFSLISSHYVTTVLLPFTIALIYWYFTRTFNYWLERGVHHEKPELFFGNLKDRVLFRKSFHEFQMDVYKKFKGHKIAGFFMGKKPSLIILDPDLIKIVLVRDFDHFMDRPVIEFRDSPYIKNMLLNLKGSNWKAVRTQMTPAVSSGKLKAMEPLITICAKQMDDYLNHLVINLKGGEIDVKDFFGRFTMDVIASCAFGVQCDSLKDPDAEFIRKMSQFQNIKFSHRTIIFMALVLMPSFTKYLPLSFFNMDSINFLVDAVKKAKEFRNKDSKNRRNDFLQLMLDAELHSQDSEKGQLTPDNSRFAITEEVVIAQTILFLIAGFETSSTLLTFTCYELALNIDVQDKLRDEIMSVLDNHGGECNYQALNEMNYLEMVLNEALRKHPSVAGLQRVCTQKYKVPGTDVTLSPGDSISIPIIGMHYDHDYFPHPERFDPDRFLPENKNERSPYVFLPFGAGPRNCIGLRFAMLSSKSAMVHLLKRYRLTTCAKTEVPYKYNKFSMLLTPVNGIWLKIEKI